mmetsp:Transcript_62203/g.200542  ORF Transcript_62203/g.200542 Transcript_62203/m.200542 type:complete len:241 (-) Transcript_62203:1237-1959(-)
MFAHKGMCLLWKKYPMNSKVATKTFGAPCPFGNGHCSLPRLCLFFPTPGGAPIATATVHSSCTSLGNKRPSCRATSAVCSQSSRFAVMISVSGAHCAQKFRPFLLLGFLRTRRGQSTALTPSSPSQRTPTMGSTRSMTPWTPGVTLSPDPYVSSSVASTSWPTFISTPLRASRRRGFLRSQGIHPRPSAISIHCTEPGEPVALFAMNSSPTFRKPPAAGANSSGLCRDRRPLGPACGSTR